MNARQSYRYLFSAIATDETTTISDFFNKIKGNDKFRSILRILNASEIEKILYGNNTDELIWLSYFSKLDYAKDFKRFNDRYNYLTFNAENILLYRRIYYIVEIMLMMSQKELYFYYNSAENTELYAYELMTYFGIDNNAESILNKFDLYCSTNNLSHNRLTEIFPRKLRELNCSIQLSAWQNIIAISNSPEAIALLRIAPEIETFLGRAPSDIVEAKICSESLVCENEWSHQGLVEILSLPTSNESQLNFISSLNEKNLHALIRNHHDFCDILSSIKHPEIQLKLLERLGSKAIQSFANDDYMMSANMLMSIQVINISYLIKAIGIDVVLKGVNTAFDLLYFMETSLPDSYDKSRFLTTDLSDEKIQSYIQDQFDLKRFLAMVNYKERLNFLLNIIGKEKLAHFVKPTFFLCQIAAELQVEERLTFLKEVLSHEDLINIRKESSDWHNLKSILKTQEDKLALNKLVYSEEDLVAKATLKNIKHTIQETKWSFGLFEQRTGINLGRRSITAPEPVVKQVHQFLAVANGRKSHAEALKKIKKIGQETTTQAQTWAATANNLLFSKGETQKYFEKFDNEEAFNKAFVLKK
jgi:hypothetical protein